MNGGGSSVAYRGNDESVGARVRLRLVLKLEHAPCYCYRFGIGFLVLKGQAVRDQTARVQKVTVEGMWCSV